MTCQIPAPWRLARIDVGSPELHIRPVSGLTTTRAALPERGSLRDDSTVALRFVQDRVALFGKTIFIFSVVFLGMAVSQVLRGAESVLAPGREGHLLATAIALSLWLVARRPKVLSPVALNLLDSLGTLGLTLCLVVMGYRYSQLHQFGHFAGTISVFHVVMARAILVPSSPWRTLVVRGLSFAFLVVSQVLLLRPEQMGFVIGPITSGATGTALAAVASKVIYGLHRDVRRARQLGQYTLEEKIGEMIEQKRRLAGQVVGEGEEWLTELSNDELKGLLALREEAVTE